MAESVGALVFTAVGCCRQAPPRPTHEELFGKCPHVRTSLRGLVPYCLDCRELICQGTCREKCWLLGGYY